MKLNLNDALDESLALLETGQASLEECAARYPEYSADLLCLLATALEVRRVDPSTPSPAASVAGKRRMLQALVEKDQPRAVHPTILLRLAVVTVSALVLIAAAGLLFTLWQGGSVTQAATLAQVTSSVEILRSGGDAWQLASPDMQVGAGTRIRTGPFSSATLVFGESTVRLEAETEISIVEVGSQQDDGSQAITLRQTLGQTHCRVGPLSDPESRFQIETPSAVIAVHGTEFTVAVETDGTTSVSVVEGLVEVEGQGNTVEVQTGQQTVVQPGRPPEPTRPASMHTPPGLTRTPQPPGLTKTPQPPGLTKTPQPPGLTKTPQPPGLTKTPQPPGLTKTPQPPGRDEPPQPPGQDKPPQPTKESKPKK